MNKPEDILQFVKEWRSKKGIADDVKLTEKEITDFVGDLQKEVTDMNYAVNKGTTIIGYSGSSNGKRAFKIVEEVVNNSKGSATYITSLPAGELLGKDFRETFEELITKNITGDKNATTMITGGWSYDERQGAKCGYGDYLSLDDFVSAKLMGEATGASKNIIIFIPERVDPTKVFATE